MFQVSHFLIAEIIQRPMTRMARKVLCLCILILLAIPFQPSGVGLAKAETPERLPVVLLQELKNNVGFIDILSAIQAAGFVPRTVREDDFSFNVTPQTNHTVIVPVGSHISPEELNQLAHYVAKGGRLIVIPMGETPDASVERLLSLVELPMAQLVQAPTGLSLNWKGLVQSSGENLRQAGPLVRIQPNLQTTILATWGSDLPAIATTNKGALLNWCWGQQLSSTLNTIALTKVIYPGRPDPLILLQQADNNVNKVLPKEESNQTVAPSSPTPNVSLDSKPVSALATPIAVPLVVPTAPTGKAQPPPQTVPTVPQPVIALPAAWSPSAMNSSG